MPKLWIWIINITSNNQRLWCAGNNDQRSKNFCSNIQGALRKFHTTDGQNTCDQITGIEGPNARDQIAFFTFHSLEVQTNAGYIHAMHAQ